MKRVDPIINELHRVRENMGRKFGFDVRRIGEALRGKEGQGHQLVTRRARRTAKKKAS